MLPCHMIARTAVLTVIGFLLLMQPAQATPANNTAQQAEDNGRLSESQLRMAQDAARNAIAESEGRSYVQQIEDIQFSETLRIILWSIGLAYFLPAAIAISKLRTNMVSIFILNLFLGWTLVGWVAALVWATSFDQHKAMTKKLSERPSAGE